MSYSHEPAKIIIKKFKNYGAMSDFLYEKNMFSDDTWKILNIDKVGFCRKRLKTTFRFQKDGKLKRDEN